MNTQLLYLEHMQQYTCEARALEVRQDGDRFVIILDQTVFYPQGGGQPYDTGLITCDDKKFLVEEVRFLDGEVYHIGRFDGEVFAVGDVVSCTVDVERRQLHSRLHSAGHVVDMALWQMSVGWVPGKGYHFPNGPYVEYFGNLDGMDKEKIKAELESICNKILSEGVATKVLFMPKEQMEKVCVFVPERLPEHKPGRVVMYGEYGVPCGGTHVGRLSDIGKIVIRKVKQDGDHVKVSYAIV